MTNVNAAIGIAQLERLVEMLERRREIALAYDEALIGCNSMTSPPSPEWANPRGWLYSVRCVNAEVANSMVEYFRAKNIEVRKFWRSLSRQSVYSESHAFLSGVSQGLTGTVVSLPSSSSLTDEELAEVISVLRSFDGSAVLKQL